MERAQFNIRCTPEQLQVYKAEAARRGISMQALARLALDETISKACATCKGSGRVDQ